ncbi:MAG: DUF559 domain-containing protein [Actinomycetota bacterium]
MKPGQSARTSQVEVDREISTIAAAQFGVFSREQALCRGATRHTILHRVTSSRWEQIDRNVFRIAGTPESWRQSLMVALLAWGADTAISHRAGAALRSLSGFDEQLVEITVPRERQRQGPGLVYRNQLPQIDISKIDCISVTTVARTLIDIASIATREQTEIALDDALRRRLISIPRLQWRLAKLGRGRAGVGTLRRLVEERRSGTSPQSPFETLFFNAVMRSRLPRPQLQYKVRHKGKVVARLDFAWPDQKFTVETDGYEWHSGRIPWERDLSRGNILTLLGWRVLRVTWTDWQSRKHEIIEEIRGELQPKLL